MVSFILINRPIDGVTASGICLDWRIVSLTLDSASTLVCYATYLVLLYKKGSIKIVLKIHTGIFFYETSNIS